jgi:hypothetical protein
MGGLCLLAATLASAQTAGSITNTDLPVITITAPDNAASEAGDPGLFVLHRAGPTNLDLNVFLVIGGTATNGVDYAAIPNWIPMPAGVREVGIPVNPLMDTVVEGPETVVLSLMAPPVMIPVNYLIGTPSEARVVITDTTNPPPPSLPVVTVLTVDGVAVEPTPGNPPNVGVFRVFRDGPTNDTLNVHYTLRGTASNGVDYALLPNVAVIQAGDRTADVVVTPLADNLTDGVETVNIRLDDVAATTTVPPPPGSYVVGTPREAALTIADSALNTNVPPFAVIVRPLDGQLFAAPVNVPIGVDTVDPDGYVRRVEFYADNVSIGVREKTFVTPPAPGDHIGYDFVWTNAPVGRHVLTVKATDNGNANGWSAPVAIWIVNTNPPPEPCVTITAADPVAAEGTNCLAWTGGSAPTPSNAPPINTALFLVHRTGPTNDPLTVYYHVGGTASNGVDYLELPGSVTIAAGRRAAEILVVPIDDAIPEPIETVIVRLREPPTATNAVPAYHIGFPACAAAVIVDNDGPQPTTGVLPDRCFQVTLPGANGQWFRIECSTDGGPWVPLTICQVVDGAVHFVDPDAGDVPNRMYRAVPDSPPAE